PEQGTRHFSPEEGTVRLLEHYAASFIHVFQGPSEFPGEGFVQKRLRILHNVGFVLFLESDLAHHARKMIEWFRQAALHSVVGICRNQELEAETSVFAGGEQLDEGLGARYRVFRLI